MARQVPLSAVAFALALWVSPAAAQSPVRVNLQSGWCRRILNTEQCAAAIEAHQIPRSAGRARRINSLLQLRLKSGRWLPVPRDSTSQWPASYYYLGFQSAIGYFVLWAQHPEGNSIRVVSWATGWSAFIDELPALSPSAVCAATASTGYFNPNRLSIYRLSADSLTLAWRLDPAGEDWVPASPRWRNARTLVFDRLTGTDAGDVSKVLGSDTVRLDQQRCRSTRP